MKTILVGLLIILLVSAQETEPVSEEYDPVALPDDSVAEPPQNDPIIFIDDII